MASCSNRHVPAHLSFLAIFNAEISDGEEAFRDQIVFYFPKTSPHGRGRPRSEHENEDDERLRQVGLARGLADFARGFSDGRPVEYVETEKSRIVLHELEKAWWIVAVSQMNLMAERSLICVCASQSN